MPSTYRTYSPREIADALGVSESSVKRWVDAGELTAMRTAGGHRRITLASAVRFIRQHRLTLVKPAALGLADLSRLPVSLASVAPTVDLLMDLLQSDHPEWAGGLIVAAYLRGETLASVFDGPVREAMHRVGHLWKAGRRGIGVEHRATDIVVRAINEIRLAIPPAGAAAPVAVGGARASDPYFVPSLMAAAVLADLGFAVDNLGPDTPADVLAGAARERRAALVWLSASAGDPDEVSRSIRDLAEYLRPTDVAIVVGGRATEGLVNGWSGITHRTRMQGLVEVAQEICGRQTRSGT